ncbi:MAG TPA: hypothetical protein VE487_10025 [Ilumatobacter sp.]|jgi:hypothetical protein|nr:hypothetical protein [Ilumatobacter sp.]
MNLFRSEEHIDTWLGGRVSGATISVLQLCDLAYAWWGDRLHPAWQPHTHQQNQATLERVGLTGEFWRLP